MGNQNNRAHRNNQLNQAVNNNPQQLKCPRCGFLMPHGSNVHDVQIFINKFANHIRACLSNSQENGPQEIVNHPMIINKNNFRYEKVRV